MRTLNFIVDKQIIRRDENCDFSDIVSNTTGYYQAAFCFTREWKDLKKIAVFRNRKVTKYVPLFENKCNVPDEITNGMTYWVSVYGKGNDVTLTTTEVAVLQKRGVPNG